MTQDQTNYEQNNLEFLKRKIQEIKIAMFKPEKNDWLQLPNNIISTLKVDDDGHVWFYTSQKGNWPPEQETFFAYLEYYQKGRDCRLRINGKASVVVNNNEVPPSLKYVVQDSSVSFLLLKVKIMQAEYIVTKPINKIPLKEKIKTVFSNLFFAPEQRVFDFS